MARISPLVLLPPVLFAGIAAMFLWGMGRDNPDDLPSALIGRQAPADECHFIHCRTPSATGAAAGSW